MKKYFPHISSLILTFILILLVVLVAPDFVNAQTTPPTNLETLTKATEGGGWGSLLYLLTPVRWVAGGLGVVAVAILKLASYLTYLSGTVLNYIVQYTVVDMKLHIEEANAVNNAWGVIRDVANMGFIFVLLYAAIQTILGIGSDTKKLIVNIIVVAILINFSLFFTKLVIDASNVLAITFYDAIAPGALSSDASIGLSTSLMQPLGVQSIWKIAKSFEGEQLLTIGIMGTIVSLIAAFIFFAVAIMFVIRFVVLIFVLILSPIAFMAFVLPQLKKHADQWKDALIGQAFFAPIYFLLTWIVIVVARGMPMNIDGTGKWVNIFVGADGSAQGGPPSATDIGLIVNFIIIIAMLITSLVIAKEWSGKAGGGVSKLTGWAMGAAGGATMGMAGRVGRNTLGAAASRLSQSEGLQRWAGRSMIGQTVFKGVGKTAKSSFDLRATKLGGIPGLSDAGQAQQGGYEGTLQKKIEKKDKFAQSLRSNHAKEAYATRIAGGPLTRAGSRSSVNSVFGVLGRQNRVVASKILNDRVTKLQTDLNSGNTELTRYQNILNSNNGTGVLNATQQARYTLLNSPVGINGSLAYIQNNITNLQNQADNSGLNNLTAAQQAANEAHRTARTPGPTPHRGTRADEQ